MSEIKPRCSERVFSGQRWDILGHTCTRNAVGVFDGKPFCGLHSPEGKNKRNAAWQAKYGAERAAEKKVWEAKKEHNRRAEAYPKLVVMVRHLEECLEDGHWQNTKEEIRNLLRELGEMN